MEMLHDMELVVDELSLGRVAGLERGVAKGFPHVEDDEADSLGFLGSEPLVEGIEAGLGAVGSTKPDGASAKEIAGDNAIGMAWPDGNFINTDDLGSGGAGTIELLLHVLFVEILDRMPFEVEVLGDILHGGDSAVASDTNGEAMGVAWIVGQPIETFAFHGITRSAVDASNGDVKVDASSSGIEVADVARGLVVERVMDDAADAAGGFFERRRSGITTA